VFARTAGRSVATGFGTRPMPRPEPGSRAALRQERMASPARQVEEMDARGIDINVLSTPTVIMRTAEFDAATELDLNRRLNDTIAGWIGRYPTRFAGMFTLPLQDIDRSLGEMERSVRELGLRTANLPASVKGDYLGHPRFQPFWEAARALGVSVFIHPDGVADPWYQDYGLWNSLGQAIDETRVMASLIYEGVLDRFPEVPIVVSHGGGYMPHYMGRMDRNVENMPDSTRNITRKPSDYLKSFWYDTCVYDASTLVALAKIVGPDRLVMGSDYPLGDMDPVGFVEQSGAATGADLAAVAGGNAARILGLAASRRDAGS
jgi:aminocarboxymuconate-semialdehyde decarboxylase